MYTCASANVICQLNHQKFQYLQPTECVGRCDLLRNIDESHVLYYAKNTKRGRGEDSLECVVGWPFSFFIVYIMTSLVIQMTPALRERTGMGQRTLQNRFVCSQMHLAGKFLNTAGCRCCLSLLFSDQEDKMKSSTFHNKRHWI